MSKRRRFVKKEKIEVKFCFDGASQKCQGNQLEVKSRRAQRRPVVNMCLGISNTIEQCMKAELIGFVQVHVFTFWEVLWSGIQTTTDAQ